MQLSILFSLFLSSILIEKCSGISSPVRPFTTHKHSTELQADIADLWWTVDDAETEIIFELHIKTTGWIALGISPVNFSRPIMDTTTDWIALNGTEQNGWTVIRFKRLLDTCDPMDVPIKSGTNNLIFAYGLVDPDPCKLDGDITYHEGRRGSRILPLRSYANPPPEDKFARLDYVEFRFNNYLIPAADTTYYCEVQKAPTNYSTKRHAIGVCMNMI
ncbi:unnamed protein product [Didymodactylos carnosus]|uniref:DOMON domain-containing protein n=1 Tax=Didymodactylos carnosus TaxID=1234261 RepID=A0A8S2F7L3_9BILA|nr:unnamed protein product [Didymodactylos carnosus]CAF4167826.1 unnamed protein product [Didymodactylos carnosus]